MAVLNIIEKDITNFMKSKQTQRQTQQDDMHAAFISTVIDAAKLASIALERDLPNAAPVDLLTKAQYAELTEIINSYGIYKCYIDENYVALLIAMSQYEKIDIKSKIHEHIRKKLSKEFAAIAPARRFR